MASARLEHNDEKGSGEQHAFDMDDEAFEWRQGEEEVAREWQALHKDDVDEQWCFDEEASAVQGLSEPAGESEDKAWEAVCLEVVGVDGAGDGASCYLDFPVRLAGCIIGLRGKEISGVQRQSGAKVWLKKESERCKVEIFGTSQQVEVAKTMVQSLAKGTAARLEDTNADETFEIPRAPKRGQRAIRAAATDGKVYFFRK